MFSLSVGTFILHALLVYSSYHPLFVLIDLTQAEQAVLVEILVASVRQASEGPVLAGRSGAKKVSGGNVPMKQKQFCENILYIGRLYYTS